MPEDNEQHKPAGEATPATDNIANHEPTIQVHNPFTGEEVEITQEQLENVEKGIEAQTERDLTINLTSVHCICRYTAMHRKNCSYAFI